MNNTIKRIIQSPTVRKAGVYTVAIGAGLGSMVLAGPVAGPMLVAGGLALGTVSVGQGRK